MYQVFRFACLRRKHLNGKLKLDVYVGVLKKKARMGIGGGERDNGKRWREKKRQRKGSSEVRGQKEKIIRYRS